MLLKKGDSMDFMVGSGAYPIYKFDASLPIGKPISYKKPYRMAKVE